MAVLTKRPALVLAGAIWLGICLAHNLDGSPLIPITAIGGAVVTIAFSPGYLPARVALAFAFLGLGILRSPQATWNEDRPILTAHGDQPVIAEVTIPPSLRCYDGQAPAIVTRVLVGQPELAGRRVLLEGVSADPGFKPTSIKISGRLVFQPGGLNPGRFDWRQYWSRRGIVAAVRVFAADRSGQVVRHSPLGCLRRRLKRVIEATDSTMAGLLCALLLGSRSDLDAGLSETMKQAGIYHVLAISGLHVGIALVVITIFLRTLRLWRSARLIIEIALVLGYVILTGCRPSAQRAFAFFGLLRLMRLLQWKTDVVNSIGLVAVILLLSEPWLAWDIGFRLSVAATLGIAIVLPDLGQVAGSGDSLTLRLRRYVLLCLFASLAAQTFTLPLLTYYFGRVSVMGFALNLIALPMVTLIVTAGLEASIAVLISPSLAKIFIGGAALLSRWLIAIATRATQTLDATIVTGTPSAWQVMLALVLVGWLVVRFERMPNISKAAAIGLVWLALVMPFTSAGSEHLEMTFLYVGHGDATLIRSGDWTLLVDTGPRGQWSDAAQTHILPALFVKGISRLDMVVITHPHSDHFGGLESLMQAIEIGEIRVSTFEGDDDYCHVLDKAKARGIPVRTFCYPDSITLGRLTVTVLSPDSLLAQVDEDPNLTSIVMKLTYGAFEALLCADAPREVQRNLIERWPDLRATLLKVPHHGRADAMDETFLRTVNPSVAVVSAGPPRGGHAEAIAHLEGSGLEVVTTYHDGAIEVTTDGEWCQIDCFGSKKTLTIDNLSPAPTIGLD